MKHQIKIVLSDAMHAHFLAQLEREGCTSITEMFRKAIFSRWPMLDGSLEVRPGFATANQESFPHTPFKEYNNNNNNNISNACAREEKPKKPKSAEPKFVPPTLDEVREHIAAKGYTFDAEHFWSFYTAKGWRVGSHVMKSWHAACTTWQKNSDQRNKTEAIRQAHYDAKMDEREAIRQAHIDARFDKRDAAREAKQNAAASASNNSRYYNGRLKLSNHVDISEEERNDLLKDFFA